MSKILEWKINGTVLQFEETNHTYYYNGVRCPSVTQVLSYLYPNKYKGVSKEVLDNASKRGTAIHNAIELYEKFGLEMDEIEELDNYIKLKEKNDFSVIMSEIPVVIRYKDMCICGRLDEIVKEEDLIGIADIKATYELDRDYLISQTNLYRLGVHQCYDFKIDFLRGIHLRKNIKKYVALPIQEQTAYDILENYYENVFKKENEKCKI